MDSLELRRGEIAASALTWLEDKRMKGQSKDHVIKIGAELFFKENHKEKAQLYDRMMNSNRTAMEVLQEFMNESPEKSMELLYDVGKIIVLVFKDENEQADTIFRLFREGTDIQKTEAIQKEIPKQEIKSVDTQGKDVIVNYPENILSKAWESFTAKKPEEKVAYDKATASISGGCKEKLSVYLNKNQDKIQDIYTEIDNELNNLIKIYEDDHVLKGVAAFIDKNPEISDNIVISTNAKEDMKSYLIKHPDKIEEMLGEFEKIVTKSAQDIH